jgi:hypothetical protein
VVKALVAKPLRLSDFIEIGEILAIAEPLRAALDAILTHLRDLRRYDGRTIKELTPASVTETKAYYMNLNETHGLRSRYLALALLNRLAEPWQILRVGRALSWKPNDALVRDTEFGVIGARLVLDAQRLSRAVVAATETRRNEQPDCVRISAALNRYMDAVEGLTNEFGFRRDSDWGEAIMQSRATAASAFDHDILERIVGHILNLMPTTRRPGAPRGFGEQADVNALPDKTTIDNAMAAARLLVLLMQRGQRHGFSHAAREVLDQLGETIEERAIDLLGELKLAPQNGAIIAQFQAMSQACDLMYEDGRGALLLRRMNLARRDSA